MPAGVIVGWPSGIAIPQGWTAFTGANGRYVEISTTVGPVNGENRHTHGVQCVHAHSHTVWLNTPSEIGLPTFGLIDDPGSTLLLPALVDNHQVTTDVPASLGAVPIAFYSQPVSTSCVPPYYTLRLIRSSGTAAIPVGAFVFGLRDVPPAGYQAVSTPSYYVRGATSTGEVNSGSLLHGHSGTYNHAIPSHRHTVSGVTMGPSNAVRGVKRGMDAATSAPSSTSHTHSEIVAADATHTPSAPLAYSLESTYEEPAYYCVALWQKVAAVEYEPQGIAVLANSELPYPQWQYVSAADSRLLRLGSPGATGGAYTHTHVITPGDGHGFTVSSASQAHDIIAVPPTGSVTAYVALSGGTSVDVKTGDHWHAIYYVSGSWSTSVGGATSVEVGQSGWDLHRYRLGLFEFASEYRKVAASGSAETYATSSAFGRLHVSAGANLGSSTSEAALGNYLFRSAEGYGGSMSVASGWGRNGDSATAAGLGQSMSSVRRRREAPRRSTRRRL